MSIMCSACEDQFPTMAACKAHWEECHISATITERNKALLQAAVAMYIMGVRESVDDWSLAAAVKETKKLLAEIEKGGAE